MCLPSQHRDRRMPGNCSSQIGEGLVQVRNLVSKPRWTVRSDSPGRPLGFKYLIIRIHISTCKCVFVCMCAYIPPHTHTNGGHKALAHINLTPYWGGTQGGGMTPTAAQLLRVQPPRICSPRFPSKSLCCLCALQSPVLSVNFLTWLW